MFILNNAFLVLGLTSDADDKVITKRYKEILHLLAIDEAASYDKDISFVDYTYIRQESAVKYAYSLLANQQKKVWQTLFWFQIITIQDQDVYALLQSEQYLGVYESWMSLYADTTNTNYLKNALVVGLLAYENNDRISIPHLGDLASSLIDGFYTLYHSNKFWDTFLHAFNMHNVVPLQKDTIDHLKQSFPIKLAQGVFTISASKGDYDLYKKFVQKFCVHAMGLQSDPVVLDILRPIEKFIKDIATLNLGQDIDKVVNLVYSSVSAMHRFENMGLYESNFMIKIRDDLAKKIRMIAVDVYNDYSNPAASLTVMQYALGLFHDIEYKNTCQKDIDYLQSLVSKTPKKDPNPKSSYRTGPLPTEYVGKTKNIGNSEISRSSYRMGPLPSENVGKTKHKYQSTRPQSSYRRGSLPPENVRGDSIQNNDISSGLTIQDIILWFIVLALSILVIMFV